MKILMTTTDHLMIDRRILQEAKSLVNQGHQVILLAGFKCLQEEFYELNGIKIKRYSYDWKSSNLYQLIQFLKLERGSSWSKILIKGLKFVTNYCSTVTHYEKFILEKMEVEEFDLLHIHDFPMLSTGTIMAQRRAVPLIYDAHELYYAQIQIPKLLRYQFKKKESKLIHQTNDVITVNPYIAKLMQERYQINRPHVIVNALPEYQVTDSKQLREKFALPVEAKIVLYQGWIASSRGIEKIIEAATFFDPNIYFILIGYGEHLDVLKEMVASRQLTRKVFFYGGVASDELHELTCQADLGIIPYYGVDDNNYYCSPNKLFEFTVAHLPFICNDLPFLRDIVSQYGHGVTCNLRDSQEIASIINSLIADKYRLLQLKQSAKNAAKALNWEVEEQKLLEIYQKYQMSY